MYQIGMALLGLFLIALGIVVIVCSVGAVTSF